jgi:hypothetical protein
MWLRARGGAGQVRAALRHARRAQHASRRAGSHAEAQDEHATRASSSAAGSYLQLLPLRCPVPRCTRQAGGAPKAASLRGEEWRDAPATARPTPELERPGSRLRAAPARMRRSSMDATRC